MSLKIAKIALENFKQFLCWQELELSTDGKKNITLIQGNNALGKTNLMAALGWCFYGHSIINGVSCMPYDVISDQLKKTSNEGKQFITAVDVVIIYRERKYKVRRQITYRIVKSKPAEIHSSFSLYLLKPNGEELLSNILTLDSLIPQDIAAHFFLVWDRIFLFGLSLNNQYVKDAMSGIVGSDHARNIPKVARECNRLFKAMVGNDSRYISMNIYLTKGFQLQLRDKAGRPIMETLPSEPMAALGLAFVLSLVKLSKYKFPVILDSPFLWFTHYQENVANSLKSLKRQLVLLANDAELYNMEGGLSGVIGKHHILSLNENADTMVMLKN